MANHESTTNMTASTLAHSVNFTTITKADVPALMPIEKSCHSHPWSENTLVSCIGGRYFGKKIELKSDQNNLNNEHTSTATTLNSIGFYIGEIIIGEATLMDICVVPAMQGKGYGKILLHQFLAQAKQQGATKIFLEVRAKNITAQMLYMNAGFIELNRRTGYYPSASGFGYEDAIVMSLRC